MSKSSTIDIINLQEPLLHDNTIIQLRELYKTRMSCPVDEWPCIHEFRLDCESLSHYIMKGMVGRFDLIETSNINRVDLKSKCEHKPYTCYIIWEPTVLWLREEKGFWGVVHFFTHLEDGAYISKNGLGPIRLFYSYETMLEADAFPRGYRTEHAEATSNIEQSVIGESMICAIDI